MFIPVGVNNPITSVKEKMVVFATTGMKLSLSIQKLHNNKLTIPHLGDASVMSSVQAVFSQCCTEDAMD